MFNNLRWCESFLTTIGISDGAVDSACCGKCCKMSLSPCMDMHVHFGSILKNRHCIDNVFKEKACKQAKAQKHAWSYNGVVNPRPLQLFLSSFLEEQYLPIHSTALVSCYHSKLKQCCSHVTTNISMLQFNCTHSPLDSQNATLA